LVAGHRAPFEPPRDVAAEPHVETTRPGELVGIDCFYLGRLRGSKGPVWQITAIDTYSSFAWADLIACPSGAPSFKATSALARRVATELRAAGWKLERVITDNGPEFGRRAFDAALPDDVAHTQIRAGRPQSNGHVERLHRTILEECWRPAFARSLVPKKTALALDLDEYLIDYNYDRAHTGRLTKGRVPADIVFGARKTSPGR
jgi:transposase InsO family protein